VILSAPARSALRPLMGDLLGVLGIGAVMFVSTNVDDIFVLLALFADPAFRPGQVIAGQLAGIASLFLLSAAGAALALVVAPAYVGLLGLAPLGLGIWRLLALLRGREDVGEEAQRSGAAGSAARVLAVALVTVANGGDNIGVYVPVFASQPRAALAVFAGIFFVMTCLWCLLGYYLVSHPKLGAPIRRYAKPLTPFVLIALGLFILIESRAYALVSP
jgi:cadmium resistance protein CadD (predicted permease)